MAETNTSTNAISSVSLDLSSASAGAIQDLQGTPSSPTATPDSGAVATPVPGPGASAPMAEPQADLVEDELTLEAEEAAEEAPVEVEAPKKWSVRAGGKTLEFSEEELIERAQMGVDYEQKSQRLAAERREAQMVYQQLQTKQAQLDEIAKNPQLLDQYRKYLQQSYGLPENPDEVITAEQALRMSQLQVAQQMQVVQAQQQAREWEREVTHLTSDYEKQVTQHVASLQSKFPILESLDDLEGVLKLDVAKRIAANPTDDIGEVQRLMTEAAQKRAEKLGSTISNHKKMEAVRAAKLKANRIDPPGGSGVRPQPTPQRFTLDSPQLRQQAIADLQEAFSKKR